MSAKQNEVEVKEAVVEKPIAYEAVRDCIFNDRYVVTGAIVMALPSEMEGNKLFIRSETGKSREQTLIIDGCELADQILAKKRARQIDSLLN